MPMIRDRSVSAIAGLAGAGRAYRRLQDQENDDEDRKIARESAKRRLAAFDAEDARRADEFAYEKAQRPQREKLTDQAIRRGEVDLRDRGENQSVDTDAQRHAQRIREFDQATEELTKGMDDSDAETLRRKANARRRYLQTFGEDVPNPELRSRLRDTELRDRARETADDAETLKKQRVSDDIDALRRSGYVSELDEASDVGLEELSQSLESGAVNWQTARKHLDAIRNSAIEFKTDMRAREDLAAHIEEMGAGYPVRQRRRAIQISERLRGRAIKLDQAERDFDELEAEVHGRGALDPASSRAKDPRQMAVQWVLSNRSPLDGPEQMDQAYEWAMSKMGGTPAGPGLETPLEGEPGSGSDSPMGPPAPAGTRESPLGDARGGAPQLDPAKLAEISRRPKATPEQWNAFMAKIAMLNPAGRAQALLEWPYNPQIRPEGAKAPSVPSPSPGESVTNPRPRVDVEARWRELQKNERRGRTNYGRDD